jgi:hypothetical protein
MMSSETPVAFTLGSCPARLENLFSPGKTKLAAAWVRAVPFVIPPMPDLPGSATIESVVNSLVTPRFT